MSKKQATQNAVRIDTTQLQYLRYMSALTGTPIAAIVREAIEDHLDISYSSRVSKIEEKRGLASTTTTSDEPKDLNRAFDNILRNLKAMERGKKLRHFAAKA